MSASLFTLVALGDDGHRQLDPAVLGVELQGDFLYTTPLGNDQVNRVDDDIASGQPSVRLRDKGFECWCAFDPAANGWCSSGSPSNEWMSASVSPAIRPAK